MGGVELGAVIVALIALAGSILTNVITWRNQQQLRIDRMIEVESAETRAEQDAEDAERRDRRDRAVEIYQWAAELAVSADPARAQVGVDALAGLLEGNLLDEDTKLLVEAALSTASSAPMRAIEAALDDGSEVRVVQVAVEGQHGPDVPLASEAVPDQEIEEADHGQDRARDPRPGRRGESRGPAPGGDGSAGT
jgi:hypothetical protein